MEMYSSQFKHLNDQNCGSAQLNFSFVVHRQHLLLCLLAAEWTGISDTSFIKVVIPFTRALLL